MRRASAALLIALLLSILGAGRAGAQDPPEDLPEETVTPREFEGPEDPPPAPQETPPPPSRVAAPRPSADRDARRLFQRFAEDAAIIPGGWVEGLLSYEHFDGGVDRAFLVGLLAFQVGEENEAGLRLGFEWLEADAPDPDGTGLADIDVYFKHRFAGASPCAIGGLLKLPTADEDEGLGTGKADFEFFGACRANLEAVSFTANAGARYNGDPDPPFPESEVSILAGAGAIFPVGREMSIIVETTWESERLDGVGNDARLIIGLQGVATRPGFGFRGALALPLTDAAPDYQVVFGAVYLY